ncbi:hypothetical protein HDU77_003755, partial [Chytriomyces hyalinus]
MDQTIEEEEVVFPCDNFTMVCKGVYRSSFPKRKNFSFLKKLKLKSILTLILEEYPEQNQKFLNENNIKLFQFGVAGNKDLMDIPEQAMYEALSVILDKRNLPRKHRYFFFDHQSIHRNYQPVLIHCNKGK